MTPERKRALKWLDDQLIELNTRRDLAVSQINEAKTSTGLRNAASELEAIATEQETIEFLRDSVSEVEDEPPSPAEEPEPVPDASVSVPKVIEQIRKDFRAWVKTVPTFTSSELQTALAIQQPRASTVIREGLNPDRPVIVATGKRRRSEGQKAGPPSVEYRYLKPSEIKGPKAAPRSRPRTKDKIDLGTVNTSRGNMVPGTGNRKARRVGRTDSKDLNGLLNAMEKAGHSITPGGKNKLRIYKRAPNPHKEYVTCSTTPSDHNVVHQVVRELKRNGFKVPHPFG